MKLEISRPAVLVVWVSFIVYAVFALIVIATEMDYGDFLGGIATSQAILKPVAIFTAIATAIVVATIHCEPRPGGRLVRLQNGLFRIYATWAVIALLLVAVIGHIQREWDWWEVQYYFLPYLILAGTPWGLHLAFRFVALPVFRWIRRGFLPDSA